MRSRQLDERTGVRVALKCENLQRAGAFKFRGVKMTVAVLDNGCPSICAETMAEPTLVGEVSVAVYVPAPA